MRNSKENGGLKVSIQADAMAFPGLPTEVYIYHPIMILSFELRETMKPVLGFVSCCACYNPSFLQWVPPKLTLPLLDLVDVVLQLQEGGWIRYIYSQ